MPNLDAEAAKLESDLEDTLFAILLDFDAPQPARDAADRILKQRLHEQLRAALDNFHVGSVRLLELVDQLGTATASLGRRVPTAGPIARVPQLLGRAAELHRQFHDAEGMRTTHTTREEAETINRDDELPPPATVATARPLTSLSGTGPVLRAPSPLGSKKYATLADEYVRFFAGADFRDIEAERVVGQLADKALGFKSRYAAVGDPLRIPWWFIAAIHMLESSFNFATHLHNGDPLTARTFRVPANLPKRWGPPSDWESSARDALSRRDLDKQSDWSLPRVLYRLEAYNGFGYRQHGIATPYLWSLSTIYGGGKFVADGVFDRKAVSKQCGAATLLKALHQRAQIELTLDWVGEAEDALSPDFETAAEAAAREGRVTTGAAPTDDSGFDGFLRAQFPELTHFKPSDFLMQRGSGGVPPRELWPNVVELARVVDTLRTRLGQPIVLNSVYRSDEHNAAVGGVPGSQHRHFRAADIRVLGSGGPSDWGAALRDMRTAKAFQGGIGVYRSFVHVDTRGWNVDWAANG